MSVGHNPNKIIDTVTNIERHQALVRDMQEHTDYTYTAYDNRTVDFIDQLYLYTGATNVFEVGIGSGCWALQYLIQSEDIQYKGIDYNPVWQPNMDLLEGWFGDRFSYELHDYTIYPMAEDPNRTNYDLLVLNGDVTGGMFSHVNKQLALAEQSQPDWILLRDCNRDTVEEVLGHHLRDENWQYQWDYSVLNREKWYDQDRNLQETLVNSALLKKKGI